MGQIMRTRVICVSKYTFYNIKSENISQKLCILCDIGLASRPKAYLLHEQVYLFSIIDAQYQEYRFRTCIAGVYIIFQTAIT